VSFVILGFQHTIIFLIYSKACYKKNCHSTGYMDPEYVVLQELTEKSDIYSYGVLLLELVTGRRAIRDNRNLVEWAQKYMASEEMVPEMLDPTIRDWCDMDQVYMVVGVVRWCTQREGKARPSIKQVLRVFSEILDPVYEDAEEGSFF
jgi:serine/threonine protein kinase